MSRGQPAGSRLGFAKLESSDRRVSLATIRKKWKRLPDPAQQKVRKLFRSIEKPPTTYGSNDRRNVESQTAVRTVLEMYAYLSVNLDYIDLNMRKSRESDTSNAIPSKYARRRF